MDLPRLERRELDSRQPVPRRVGHQRQPLPGVPSGDGEAPVSVGADVAVLVAVIPQPRRPNGDQRPGHATPRAIQHPPAGRGHGLHLDRHLADLARSQRRLRQTRVHPPGRAQEVRRRDGGDLVLARRDTAQLEPAVPADRRLHAEVAGEPGTEDHGSALDGPAAGLLADDALQPRGLHQEELQLLVLAPHDPQAGHPAARPDQRDGLSDVRVDPAEGELAGPVGPRIGSPAVFTDESHEGVRRRPPGRVDHRASYHVRVAPRAKRQSEGLALLRGDLRRGRDVSHETGRNGVGDAGERQGQLEAPPRVRPRARLEGPPERSPHRRRARPHHRAGQWPARLVHDGAGDPEARRPARGRRGAPRFGLRRGRRRGQKQAQQHRLARWNAPVHGHVTSGAWTARRGEGSAGDAGRAGLTNRAKRGYRNGRFLPGWRNWQTR